MQYSEYRRHDAVALAELVAKGETTPGEVLETAIARAAEVNPRLNAVSQPLHEIARRRAEEPLAGPLAGVPFLLKDLQQNWSESAATGGSRALRHAPPAETSVLVQRWLDAGLVPFGRTNTPEFGAKGVTEPELFGPTRNPWDLSRTSGGSSGGAAAAVAAGIVPVAGAGDGGGSIRIPAACCGVFGLKPGRGVLPAGPGQSEGFHGAAVEGVVSRTVRDTATALSAALGPDPAGPYSLAVPPTDFVTELDREPGHLRIGYTADSPVGEPHPHARAALDDAVALLTSLGHVVEPVAPPVDLEELAGDFLAAWGVKLATILDEVRAETGASWSSFELDSRLFAAAGRTYSAPEFAATLNRWHRHVRGLARFHAEYDLLLTPSLATPPPRIGELATPPLLRLAGKAVLSLRLEGLLRRTGAVDRVVRQNLRFVPYSQLANLTGRPAMSVPLQWTPDDLPLGVQFVGPLAGEGMLLRLAAQLERARPWHDRQPAL